MSVTPDIERLVAIDSRITRADRSALAERWEFGHLLLLARDGAVRLPNGYLRRSRSGQASRGPNSGTAPDSRSATRPVRIWLTPLVSFRVGGS